MNRPIKLKEVKVGDEVLIAFGSSMCRAIVFRTPNEEHINYGLFIRRIETEHEVEWPDWRNNYRMKKRIVKKRSYSVYPVVRDKFLKRKYVSKHAGNLDIWLLSTNQRVIPVEEDVTY